MLPSSLAGFWSIGSPSLSKVITSPLLARIKRRLSPSFNRQPLINLLTAPAPFFQESASWNCFRFCSSRFLTLNSSSFLTRSSSIFSLIITAQFDNGVLFSAKGTELSIFSTTYLLIKFCKPFFIVIVFSRPIVLFLIKLSIEPFMLLPDLSVEPILNYSKSSRSVS